MFDKFCEECRIWKELYGEDIMDDRKFTNCLECGTDINQDGDNSVVQRNGDLCPSCKIPFQEYPGEVPQCPECGLESEDKHVIDESEYFATAVRSNRIWNQLQVKYMPKMVVNSRLPVALKPKNDLKEEKIRRYLTLLQKNIDTLQIVDTESGLRFDVLDRFASIVENMSTYLSQVNLKGILCVLLEKHSSEYGFDFSKEFLMNHFNVNEKAWNFGTRWLNNNCKEEKTLYTRNLRADWKKICEDILRTVKSKSKLVNEESAQEYIEKTVQEIRKCDKFGPKDIATYIASTHFELPVNEISQRKRLRSFWKQLENSLGNNTWKIK
jgi:uncharacterized Zn finger protein (UPF0148 family)